MCAALAAISIWIGVNTSSQTKTTEDYYLSGRNLGFVNLTLTFLATQLGGGAIIGGAEAASKYGWYAIYYSLGLALGLVVLSLGVGGIFRRMEIQTIPQSCLRVNPRRPFELYVIQSDTTRPAAGTNRTGNQLFQLRNGPALYSKQTGPELLRVLL